MSYSYSYQQCSKGGRTTARLHRQHDEDVICRAEAGIVTDEAQRIARRRTTEARASLRRMTAEAAYADAAQRTLAATNAAVDIEAQTAGWLAAINAVDDIEARTAEWLAAIDYVDDAECGLREDMRAGLCTWAEIEARVKALDREREVYSTALYWARHESILRSAQKVTA